MRRLMLFCLVALSLPAHAINKCAIKGKIIYTDSPCPAEAKASTITPALVVPEAERDAAQARLQAESRRAREAVRGADASIRRDYQSWRARRNEQIRQQQLAEIEARRRREQDAYPFWFGHPRSRYTPAPPPSSSSVTKPRPQSPRPPAKLNR